MKTATAQSHVKVWPPKRLGWIAAAGAMVLLLGTIVITLTRKDGTVTRIEVPDETRVEIARVPAATPVPPLDDAPSNYALDLSETTAAGQAHVKLPAIDIPAELTVELTVFPRQETRIPPDSNSTLLTRVIFWGKDRHSPDIQQDFAFKTIRRMADTHDSWSLVLHGPKVPFADWDIGSTTAGCGRYTRVAIVFTARNMRLFIDGRRSVSQPVTFHPERHFLMTIGGTTEVAESQTIFDGIVDEIRISNVARYAEDYVPQSRLAVDGHTLGLYHCDEGSGDALLDSSPHQRHGRIVGAKFVPAP